MVHPDDDDYDRREFEDELDVDPLAAAPLQPIGAFDEADFDDEFDADFDDSDIAEEDRELDAELLEPGAADDEVDDLEAHLEAEFKSEVLIDDDDLGAPGAFTADPAIPPEEF